MRGNAQQFNANEGGGLANFQAGLENFAASLGNLQGNLEAAKGAERKPRLGMGKDQAAPENIFAAALERGSAAEWESRMRDRFSSQGNNPQEKIAENSDKMVFILGEVARGIEASATRFLPGLLEFGKGF